MHRAWLLLLSIALAGCPVADDDDFASGDDDDQADDDDLGDDDDTMDDGDPWFCVDGSWTAVGDGGGLRVETPHYVLYSELEQDETETIARMLEGEYAALTDYWGGSPELSGDGRLRIELYADEAAWADGIAEDGLDVPWGAAGWFHPDTGIGYLYRQPSVWYTRVLTLHEAMHQFHWAVRDAAWVPGWFAEGHAEYLSLHDWDDACLRMGRLPLLSFEDMPAQALAQAGSLDLAAHMAQDATISRPLEWAVFRYFDRADDGAYAADWRSFRQAVDYGVTPDPDLFEQLLGSPPAEFEQPIRDWLETEQQALVPVWLEWIHVDPRSVDGFADVLSIAPLKQPPDRFELRFDVPDGTAWYGGVVLSYDDTSNMVVLLVGADGALSTFAIHGGEVSWDWVGQSVPPSGGSYRFALDHATGVTTVTINDQSATFPLDYTPAGGPALYEARIRFEAMAWE